MTGCRFFHILGILSSYAEGPIFLITGNGPALLKASFLAGWSEPRFVPSTHTRSPSLYSMAPPLFCPPSSSSPHSFFSVLLLLPSSSLVSLGQIRPPFQSMLFLVHGCLGAFWDSRRMEISQCSNVACCCGRIWPSVATRPSRLVGSWHTAEGIVPFPGWLFLFDRQFGDDSPRRWISFDS